MAHRIKLAPEVVWVVSEKDKKDLKGRQLWASQEKEGWVGFIRVRLGVRGLLNIDVLGFGGDHSSIRKK